MTARFLDAELRPVGLRDAAVPLLFAVIMTTVAAGWGLVFDLPMTTALPVFVPAFLGGILSRAGLSLVTAPKAVLATLPILALMYAFASWVAA